MGLVTCLGGSPRPHTGPIHVHNLHGLYPKALEGGEDNNVGETRQGGLYPARILPTHCAVEHHCKNLRESPRLLHVTGSRRKSRASPRPNRSSQEALVHLVSWIKAQWRAERGVGAIFADVKSAFPLVLHPKLIHTLAMEGFPPQLLNIISSFLSQWETYLPFNGFKSRRFQLTHGLPQAPPYDRFFIYYTTTPYSVSRIRINC